MHIQRPPRGQAWPWVRSLPWIRSFQLDVFRGSVSNHLYFFKSLSGSALRALHLFMTFINLLIFFVFSICPVELSEWGQYINLTLVSQCEHFVGPGPTKMAHKIFRILGKNSMSKKSKNFSFDFGSKNYADRCNLTSELRENSFFDQKKFWKFSIFGLRKLSKNFEKFVKFFQFFFSKFLNFLFFFANF